MRSAFDTARRAAWLVLIAATVPLAAQGPPPANGDFLIRNWEVDDGLPDNTVNAVTQTRDGYLWIGTPRGLARFDGVRFQVFTAANTPALAPGHVRFLTEDNEGALWIGLDGGAIARHRDGVFETVVPPGDDAANWPTSLVADARGGVWVGLPGPRAKRWRDGQWTPFGEANGLAGRGSANLTADFARRIWFTTETSYGFFDGEAFAALATDVPLPRVMPCRQGGYWLARANVLGRFDQRGEALLMGQHPWRGGTAEIQALLEDPEGVLWIGTKGQGLYRLDDFGVQRVRTTHDVVTSLYMDREGSLWVGSLGGGLDRLRLRPVLIYDKRSGLPDDVVSALCQDPAGAIWLATRAAGPIRLADGHPTLFTTTNGWPGGLVTALCTDPAGGVWFGSLTEGLLYWRANHFASKGLKGEHIEALLPSRQGSLWVATRRAGLIEWSRDRGASHLPERDAPQEITALAEDQTGRLWAGTRGGALHCFDGGRWERFATEAGLPATAIQAIHADETGTLWLGTRGAGLARLRNGRAVCITTRHGLPDDDIRQILGSEDRLWFGSSRGLFHAGRQHLAEAADGLRPVVESIRYDRHDGVGSVEFSEDAAQTACQADNGWLWFATKRGVLTVPLPLPLPRSLKPIVLIEQLLADGRPQPLPPAGVVGIPPRTRILELRYTSPSFLAPETVRFRYRLSNGAGPADWVEAGTSRAATFLNLPPGRHRFEVTTTDALGQWSGVTRTLEFDIPPALWQAPWFRAAALLAVLALAAVAVRLVVMHRVRRRLRTLERQLALDAERARIAKDMHDNLGANLTRIALLSERARTDGAAAAQIIRAAREASRALDEIVWAMNPGNDTLERLIGYLSEYATEFLAPTAIPLDQELPAAVFDTPIPSPARHGLFLAFKEALNNVVKHAAATAVSLRVAVEPDRLRVTLADNGRGFDPGAPHAAGEGLASMRQRLAATGGTCAIERAPGQGTRITFTLPIGGNRG